VNRILTFEILKYGNFNIQINVLGLSSFDLKLPEDGNPERKHAGA
jgi:hypothetical protein